MTVIATNPPSTLALTAHKSIESDENELIRRSKSDPDAFAALYRLHYRAIAGYLYRRTGDVHVAEDLAADSFISAYRAISSFKSGPVPLRYWLLRIATNAANRWSKSHRRMAALRASESEQVSPTSNRIVESDNAEEVRNAVSRLSPKYQAVLALHYFESLGIEEIAAVLACREGTVKSRLSRARNALKKTLDQGEHP